MTVAHSFISRAAAGAGRADPDLALAVFGRLGGLRDPRAASRRSRRSRRSPAGDSSARTTRRSRLVRREGVWKVESLGGFPGGRTEGRRPAGTIWKLVRVRRPVVSSGRYHDSFKVAEDENEGRIRLWDDAADDPDVDLILGSSPNYRTAHVRLAGEDAGLRGPRPRGLRRPAGRPARGSSASWSTADADLTSRSACSPTSRAASSWSSWRASGRVSAPDDRTDTDARPDPCRRTRSSAPPLDPARATPSAPWTTPPTASPRPRRRSCCAGPMPRRTARTCRRARRRRCGSASDRRHRVQALRHTRGFRIHGHGLGELGAPPARGDARGLSMHDREPRMKGRLSAASARSRSNRSPIPGSPPRPTRSSASSWPPICGSDLHVYHEREQGLRPRHGDGSRVRRRDRGVRPRSCAA